MESRYFTFRTLLSQDQDVSIQDVFHPLKIKRKGTFEDPLVIGETTTLTFGKIYCLVGKAGQGKTTLLKKLCYNTLVDEKSQVPLIITLRYVNWEDDNLTPELIVSNEFKELGISISIDACKYLLQLKRLLVMFDGFDEIADEHRKKANDLIYHTHTTFNSDCIVTSRPGTEITLYSGSMINYEVLDLTPEDVFAIISEHKQIDKEDKSRLIDTLENNKHLQELLITPILVDIFIRTSIYMPSELKSVLDLYESLFRSLTLAHDKLKPYFKRIGKSGLDNDQLEKVFWQASFGLLNMRNDINFSESELEKEFNIACEDLKLKNKNAHVDLINKSSLIIEDGVNYSYIHKSILEYHAAKYIHSLFDEERLSFYKYAISRYKVSLESVLKYLKELDQVWFYKHYVSEILNTIKANSTLLNNKEKISNDLLLLSLGFNEVCIVINKSDRERNSNNTQKNRFIISKEHDNNSSKLSIIGQHLFSVLEIERPVILIDDIYLEIYKNWDSDSIESNFSAMNKKSESKKIAFEYIIPLKKLVNLEDLYIQGEVNIEPYIMQPKTIDLFYRDLSSMEEKTKCILKENDNRVTFKRYF